jgi:hypothetical protein
MNKKGQPLGCPFVFAVQYHKRRKGYAKNLTCLYLKGMVVCINEQRQMFGEMRKVKKDLSPGGYGREQHYFAGLRFAAATLSIPHAVALPTASR